MVLENPTHAPSPRFDCHAYLESMKTIDSLDVPTGTPKVFGVGSATFFPVATARMRRRDFPASGEVISLWFAMLSPLIGLVVGFLGAWLFAWLTT